MKLGRNDPCPCGSGKKTKKCCGLPKRSTVSQISEQTTINSMFAEAWTHFQAGRLFQAGSLYKRILDLQPNNVDALALLSGIASKQGDLTTARELLERAIKIQPKRADLYSNLGYILTGERKAEEALTALTNAIKLKPDFSDAYLNRACVYKILGKIEASLADSNKCVKFDPNNIVAQTNQLYVLNCSDKVSAEAIFKHHLSFGKRYQANLDINNSLSKKDEYNHARLRIGYISPDFRTHSVAYFIEPVLRCHDNQKFEIYGYYDNNITDKTTVRLSNLCEHWTVISMLNDRQLVERIRADEIDILIDLAGYTSNSRVLAFAYKPAPVQITWIGYPNTTGLEAIDFRITDAVADPPGLTEHLYIEELLRLPDCFLCYQPPDPCPEIARPPYHKNGYITFGSFNNLGKVTDAVLSTWSRILQAVPDSRILLKNSGLSSSMRKAELLQQFAELEIKPERIELYGNDPSRYDHLNRYGDIDIALDTFPYNGTTTTCEALWMGVPVITFTGDSHRDRVGASLLHAIGSGELVARNREEYVYKAIQLANNTTAIDNFRTCLRDDIKISPLMNAEKFTKDLENLYTEICQVKK